MGRLYRPRMAARLHVPLPTADPETFDPLTFDCRISRATWVSNDHNHADTLSISLPWKDAGIDPRYLDNAIAEFYLGNADAYGAWEPTVDDLRFVGRLVRCRRSGDGDKLEVEAEFHDYTSIFIVAKPVANAAIPLLSDSLRTAWIRLCGTVPGASPLANRLTFRGLSDPPTLGSAVAARFAKLGARVSVKPDADAWAIWQQCVGMCGLISFFELDVCIVTTVTDYYTGSDPPRLIWGKNIYSFGEERRTDLAAVGVGITSFDPLTGKTLEAVYDPKAGQAKIAATAAGKPPQSQKQSKLDYWEYPGVTDPARLLEIAKRVYEERSRQELQGTVATADMTVETANAIDFDLLTLGSGDTIEVRFLGSAEAAVAATFPSEDARVKYLVSRGYSDSAARIVARHVQGASSQPEQFYTKAVRTNLETNESGGTFRVEVTFCNKIDTSGAAVAS